MNKNQIAQGDVLFFAEKELPGNIKKAKCRRIGLVTFAEGEVTGHHHSCVADGVELCEDEEGTLWCEVERTATVTHQEHNPVTLDPGVYRIGIVREVDPFEDEIRDVAD